MDLHLAGRKAIVCASSKGLGRACALSLSREGCQVVINGRDSERLQAAAEMIHQHTGARPLQVVADLNTEAGREALLAACPDADILINNNGGPPPGNYADFAHEQWIAAVESNMLAPIYLIRALVDGMCERAFGRIVNITSAMVKTPHVLMSLSTSARSGLTAFCKGLSRDVAKHNVTINNMLPERFDTDRQKFIAEVMMQQRSITQQQAREEIAATIAAGRLGTPEEFGDTCAFLCSVQASYISGQNLQLDGGSYPGLM